MRSLFPFIMFGTLLSLPVMTFAETNAECMARCSAEKAERDASCMPSEESEKEHTECLRVNQEDYNNCAARCPQSDQADMPAGERGGE